MASCLRKLAWAAATPWLTSCFTFGCGRAADAVSVERTDSAGVQIVVNSARDVILPWSFEPIITLGGADHGPASFNRVRRDLVGADEHGNVYLLDAAERRVVSFDSRGTFRWSAGREGAGPGEFRAPNSLSVSDRGEVIVHDAGKAALLRFDRDGTYLGEEPFRFQVLRWGHAIIRAWGGSLAVMAREPYRGSDIRRLTLLALTTTDTLLFAERDMVLSRTAHYPACGMAITLPVLFAPSMHWDAAAGVLVAALDAEYSVDMYVSGQRLIVRRPIEPAAVTEEYARETLSARAPAGGPLAPCGASAAEVLRNHGYVGRAQVITGVAVTPAGAVWVSRRANLRSDEVWVDTFTASGEYTGTLPKGTRLPVAFLSEGLVAHSVADEFDVERLVISRIRRSQ